MEEIEGKDSHVLRYSFYNPGEQMYPYQPRMGVRRQAEEWS